MGHENITEKILKFRKTRTKNSEIKNLKIKNPKI